MPLRFFNEIIAKQLFKACLAEGTWRTGDDWEDFNAGDGYSVVTIAMRIGSVGIATIEAVALPISQTREVPVDPSIGPASTLYSRDFDDS